MKVANPAAPKIRPPACAGRFYPADPAQLRQLVQGLLGDAITASDRAPKAIISPHAGYFFSGPVAASGHARFEPARDVIKRVILVGPSHYASFSGLAVSSVEAFLTPLGRVSLDRESIARILSLPQLMVFDEAHEPEHCLEVELPFLQMSLDEFKIVPLLAGEATDVEIAETLDVLWNGPETRIVVSSDLSHYHDYANATTIDEATARLIETLRADELDEDRACGFRAIRGLLHLAARHALKPRCIDLRNSGDTAGGRERVVGYGAFTFFESG